MSKQENKPDRFPEKQIIDLKGLLANAGQIVITTHFRPDGDAMGSSLALYNYLMKKGYKVQVITPSDYPEFLWWLPGNENVINFEENSKKSLEIISGADIIFCLDFNWLSRVEDMQEPLMKSNAKKILIDHHLDPENAFDISFSYPDACSTCELIYDFIVAMDDEKLIDRQIAESIYCGIMTDTNSFRFGSMKPRTHRIIASLMDAGAVNYLIHERIYDNTSESRLRLLGYALLEKLVVLIEFSTAYIVLTDEELDKFDFRSGDTEGLVNYALSIRGVKMAVFFAERDGGIKISFRSKGDFSVKDLSTKFFNGGGHKNASGGHSKLPLDETIQRFLEILPLYKDSLNENHL